MKASLILLLTLTTVLHATTDKTSITTIFGHDGYLFLRSIPPTPEVLHYKLGHTQSFLNTKHTMNYRLNLFPNPTLSTPLTNAYLGWFEGYWEMEDKVVKGFKNYEQRNQPVFVLYEKVFTGQVETVRISEKDVRGWGRVVVTAIEGLFPAIGNPREYMVRGNETLGTKIENINLIPLDHDRVMTDKIELDLTSILTSHKTETTVVIKPRDYLTVNGNLPEQKTKTFIDYVDLVERHKPDPQAIKNYEEMLVEDSKEMTVEDLEKIINGGADSKIINVEEKRGLTRGS